MVQLSEGIMGEGYQLHLRLTDATTQFLLFANRREKERLERMRGERKPSDMWT